ncbi:sugar ABC transporter substrate-binding protein [Tessaracoccus sp. Y36]
MTRLLKVGIAAAVAFTLTACGTTAGTPEETTANGGTTNESAGSSEQPSSGATEEYQPSEVVKPKDGKKLKIGAAFPILDQFLQTVADGMTARAEEAGVELVVVSAQERADMQLSQIENFISQDMDAIIVLPQDTDATDPITSAATAADIPLVYVNRRPAALPADIPYVGSNSLIAGQLQMEALGELINWEGNVAILQGDPSQEAAQMRTQGCKDVIDEHEGLKLIREQAGNWYRDKGLSITENWIQSGDQIDIICSNNDEMALGAIQALKAAGQLEDVVIGGVDATSDALVAMEAGELEVTVFQDAKGQGAGGVDTAIRLYNGDAVPSVIDVPYLLVTPENINEFK